MIQLNARERKCTINYAQFEMTCISVPLHFPTLSILSMIYKWNRVAIRRNAFWDCDIWLCINRNKLFDFLILNPFFAFQRKYKRHFNECQLAVCTIWISICFIEIKKAHFIYPFIFSRHLTLLGIECSDKKAYCLKLYVSWAYLSESHSHANLFSLRSIN